KKNCRDEKQLRLDAEDEEEETCIELLRTSEKSAEKFAIFLPATTGSPPSTAIWCRESQDEESKGKFLLH
ncbi:MAG: hypothetical protein MHMPM18_003341, partial [Marteilia pararefringens]